MKFIEKCSAIRIQRMGTNPEGDKDKENSRGYILIYNTM